MGLALPKAPLASSSIAPLRSLSTPFYRRPTPTFPGLEPPSLPPTNPEDNTFPMIVTLGTRIIADEENASIVIPARAEPAAAKTESVAPDSPQRLSTPDSAASARSFLDGEDHHLIEHGHEHHHLKDGEPLPWSPAEEAWFVIGMDQMYGGQVDY